MSSSFDKVKDMINDDNMKSTLVKIMNASSPEEIMSLAKEDNIALTIDQARTIYNGKNSEIEIDEDDLNAIGKIL